MGGTDTGAEAWGPPRRFGPRSEETRRAILSAARSRFATDGYDKATIRAIASDARVDPSMVMRYYGSKAELFAATARPAVDVIDLAAVPRDRLGRTFAEGMLRRWEYGESEAEAVLLRTVPTHPEALPGLQAIFRGQILPPLRSALPGDPDLERRAGLVLTQGLGVVFTRYLLRVEPVASMDFEVLLDAVGETFQRYLTAPMEQAGVDPLGEN